MARVATVLSEARELAANGKLLEAAARLDELARAEKAIGTADSVQTAHRIADLANSLRREELEHIAARLESIAFPRSAVERQCPQFAGLLKTFDDVGFQVPWMSVVDGDAKRFVKQFRAGMSEPARYLEGMNPSHHDLLSRWKATPGSTPHLRCRVW